MFLTLYIRELQNYLYSLRFQVSFVIVILVFALGGISFVSSFKDMQTNYTKYNQAQQEVQSKIAENLSRVAQYRQSFVTSPRENSAIADCKENYLPNRFTYSAFNVFEYSVRHDSNNPLLNRGESLSWSFIVSMFLSFITLLFAFDAISGEKEERTLALVFSNAVPRRTFLISKLLSVVTVVVLMELIGIIVSLLILAVSGQVQLDAGFMLETIGFIIVSMLFISTFAAFGLFSSVITRYSNISLLISLCFWLFAAVIVPNTSVFWAKKLFTIPTSEEVAQKRQQASADIEKNAPAGSGSMSGQNPFYPNHELRAKKYMDQMLSDKKYNDAYYLQQFRQFEQTRNFTLLSPIAQFDYMNEAFLGGGYLRFRKNWNDLHVFQEQFLQWFKDIDAKDTDSPHWYNPWEDVSTSKKPVAIDQIPQYQEQIASFGQRIEFISGYLIAMIVTIAVLFMACFYFFTRYDVR
ncbi:ABC transporter permease [Parabacteroides sp.]